MYNISIENTKIENISLTGDRGDASFILYDSKELNTQLNIKKMNVNNCLSNGPFIKVMGISNKFIVEDSIIKNVKSYGPIIESISEKNNIEVSVTNSIFTENYTKTNGAQNGGAIYFGKRINSTIDNKDEEIIIKNNIFTENHAYSFGGAIYSEYNRLYKSNTNNNTVTFNTAGILGGGIFVPESKNTNMFDISNFDINNNKVESFHNDFTTKPSKIIIDSDIQDEIINIHIGDQLPLIFTLYDEYDNVVVDITKYYSFILLKLTLEYYYDENHLHHDYNGDLQKINLIGNICSFNNGTCEFNKFRIFARPGNYIIKLVMENFNGKMDLDFDNLKIKVLPCDDNQIIMYDKHGIMFCETPICNSDCPIDSSANCIPYYKENINDINKNICQCIDGWEGPNCLIPKHINYGSVQRFIISDNDELNCFESENTNITSIRPIPNNNTPSNNEKKRFKSIAISIFSLKKQDNIASFSDISEERILDHLKILL
ncbi:hypothetical protein PIROE2DRAFT_7453 [Piromyces sp. E2]|nr:hypothetical protein PIROE2DRAFT_7453 [Piromyces sp. E2]|eukprot:OUM65522.1 hypothetical protein PIROE2DRAFT_7453 [Piromyces sp. E2]